MHRKQDKQRHTPLAVVRENRLPMRRHRVVKGFYSGRRHLAAGLRIWVIRTTDWKCRFPEE